MLRASTILTTLACAVPISACSGDDESARPRQTPNDAASGDTGGQDSAADTRTDSTTSDSGLDAHEDTGTDGAITDGTTTDGTSADGSTLQGVWLRLAHLAAANSADVLDVCLSPPGQDTYTPLYDLGASSGIAYGEVGKYVEVTQGGYDLRIVIGGDCENYVLQPVDYNAPLFGAWTRHTLSATLTDNGVVLVNAPDAPTQRAATTDWIRLVDGTNATADIAVTLTGAGSPVDFALTNHARVKTAKVDAPHDATFSVTRPSLAALTRAFKTVAGGAAFVGLFGGPAPADWQLTVCDEDAPEPTSGYLSPCGDTPRK